jgi:hypothetical protein
MMAKMYGQLPSYISRHGTTFDLMVTGALAEYENRLLSGEPNHNLSKDQMLEMIRQARSEK